MEKINKSYRMGEEQAHILKDVDLALEPQAIVISDKPAGTEGAEAGKAVEVRPTWSRRLELPFRVDADKANAKFENGILRIELPRTEKAGPRRIAIAG
jgi:HSP20 family protein